MGYRSDAALVLSKEAAALLKARLETATPDERYLLDNPDRYEVDSKTEEALWRWHFVKWYDEFTEVAFINNFLNELSDDDYLFLRLGESYDDVEIRGDFWGNVFELGVSTSITMR